MFVTRVVVVCLVGNHVLHLSLVYYIFTRPFSINKLFSAEEVVRSSILVKIIKKNVSFCFFRSGKRENVGSEIRPLLVDEL